MEEAIIFSEKVAVMLAVGATLWRWRGVAVTLGRVVS